MATFNGCISVFDRAGGEKAAFGILTVSTEGMDPGSVGLWLDDDGAGAGMVINDLDALRAALDELRPPA